MSQLCQKLHLFSGKQKYILEVVGEKALSWCTTYQVIDVLTWGVGDWVPKQTLQGSRELHKNCRYVLTSRTQVTQMKVIVNNAATVLENQH